VDIYRGSVNDECVFGKSGESGLANIHIRARTRLRLFVYRRDLHFFQCCGRIKCHGYDEKVEYRQRKEITRRRWLSRKMN
jgi:hypothetical protein